jgi:hypothetical protein
MKSFEQTITPDELAQTIASRIFAPNRPPLDPEAEALLLARLDANAAALDVIDRPYEVSSAFGIVLPITEEPEETELELYDANLKNLYGVRFAGRFACHSTLVLEDFELSGPEFKALCLGFSETAILPSRALLPEDHMLFVPVVAVNGMEVITPEMWHGETPLAN